MSCTILTSQMCLLRLLELFWRCKNINAALEDLLIVFCIYFFKVFIKVTVLLETQDQQGFGHKDHNALDLMKVVVELHQICKWIHCSISNPSITKMHFLCVCVGRHGDSNEME